MLREEAALPKDIYGGRDPRDVPNYTVPQAAQYLFLPPGTLYHWVKGQDYVTTSGGRKHAPPVIHLALAKPPQLSFWNLVEAYVLAGIRRYHEVPLQKVRKALKFVRDELQLERPLIQQEFFTDGVRLFVEAYGKLIDPSAEGQLELDSILRATLARIGRDPQGLAKRVFPWARDPTEPQSVEIDAERAFGKLVIAGTGIPTEVVAERMRAGDSIAHLARDYHLDPSQVEAAVRWELRAPTA